MDFGAVRFQLPALGHCSWRRAVIFIGLSVSILLLVIIGIIIIIIAIISLVAAASRLRQFRAPVPEGFPAFRELVATLGLLGFRVLGSGV